MRKYFLFALLLIILTFTKVDKTIALEYQDLYAGLSQGFSALLDAKEGQTVFRSLYIPTGGRAEAMGSAFTGLSNDIGFLEFNPAASSVLESSELAVFHNAWIADSSVDTFALTSRNNNFGWGTSIKCFYVPFTEYNHFGQRSSGGYYSETTATLNFAYNFFSGYKFKGLAFGANIKAAYRSVPDYADDFSMTIIEKSGLSQSAIAFMADLGFQIRFNLAKNFSSRDPNFQIGLVATNLGAAFTGLDKGAKLDDALPTHFALGISYQVVRPVILTLEFRQPINILDVSKSEMFSAGFGLSVQCTHFFSFQTGFLLSGANPRFSFGTEFEVKKFFINVNYTFDMTSSINPVNRISLCAKMNLGDKGRKALQEEVDSLYIEGLQLYNEEMLEEAIDVWKQSLALDPSFDPAKEGIENAQNMIDLIRRIKEYQSLD
ncbi:MAG: UPF0164 family protein [Treponema sp.]|jgi:hypothetical protein|nr:UPF0164 family protein [Treponema sp.]